MNSSNVKYFIFRELGIVASKVKIIRVRKKDELTWTRYDVIFTVREVDAVYAYEKIYKLMQLDDTLKIRDYGDWKALGN